MLEGLQQLSHTNRVFYYPSLVGLWAAVLWLGREEWPWLCICEPVTCDPESGLTSCGLSDARRWMTDFIHSTFASRSSLAQIHTISQYKIIELRCVTKIWRLKRP
jgi:hypothetical protein